MDGREVRAAEGREGSGEEVGLASLDLAKTRIQGTRRLPPYLVRV